MSAVTVLALYGLSDIGTITGPSVLSKNAALPTINLEYTDFLTVIFTGATLVLAGVALIVGIVAMFTYQGIKREARNAIEDEVKKRMEKIDERITKEVGEQAETKLTELFENAGAGGEFDEVLQKALLALGQGNAESSGELEVEFDPNDDGER